MTSRRVPEPAGGREPFGVAFALTPTFRGAVRVSRKPGQKRNASRGTIARGARTGPAAGRGSCGKFAAYICDRLTYGLCGRNGSGVRSGARTDDAKGGMEGPCHQIDAWLPSRSMEARGADIVCPAPKPTRGFVFHYGIAQVFAIRWIDPGNRRGLESSPFDSRRRVSLCENASRRHRQARCTPVDRISRKRKGGPRDKNRNEVRGERSRGTARREGRSLPLERAFGVGARGRPFGASILRRSDGWRDGRSNVDGLFGESRSPSGEGVAPCPSAGFGDERGQGGGV
jgi:hypothetical protein